LKFKKLRYLPGSSLGTISEERRGGTAAKDGVLDMRHDN